SHRIKTEGDKAFLSVGPTGWTLPVPIVKGASGWSFDLAAGKKEVTARQIGRNENEAIQAVLAYRDAQFEYAEADHNKDGTREYRKKSASSTAKQDGLSWRAKEGERESPPGPMFGAAPPGGQGFPGSRFPILTAQGESAPGGAYDSLISNRL